MKLLNTYSWRFFALTLFSTLSMTIAFAQDNTAQLQQLATTAANSGTAMVIPAGSYNISSPIEICSSVTMAPDTKIKATQAMSAIFRVGSFARAKDIVISGGVIDGNNLTDGIWLRCYAYARLTGIRVQNALKYGFRIGDPTLSWSYEAIGNDLFVTRTAGTIPTDSVALFIDTNAGDGKFNQAALSGMDIGVRIKNGGNYFSNIRACSTSSTQLMSIAFDDQSNGNFWSMNSADTVLIGIHAVGYNTMISQCRFNNNGDFGNPAAVGIKFEKSQPWATVIGCLFIGSTGHPLAADVTGATPVAEPSKILRWVGNVTSGPVTVSH